MQGQDPGLPPGCSVTDIPGNRPGDEEIDITVQLTLCRSEVEEIAEAGVQACCWDSVAEQVVADIGAHAPQREDERAPPW